MHTVVKPDTVHVHVLHCTYTLYMDMYTCTCMYNVLFVHVHVSVLFVHVYNVLLFFYIHPFLCRRGSKPVQDAVLPLAVSLLHSCYIAGGRELAHKCSRLIVALCRQVSSVCVRVCACVRVCVCADFMMCAMRR